MGVTRIRDSEINVGCVVLRRALLVFFALACIQVQVMGRGWEGARKECRSKQLLAALTLPVGQDGLWAKGEGRTERGGCGDA